MATYRIAEGMALDSAGTDGATSEVSQAVPMDGTNAIQLAVLAYALTATNISAQVQVSNDGYNWSNFGTAQTMTAFGRKIFTSDTAVAAQFVRIKFSITGTGKAILDADLNLSPQ